MCQFRIWARERGFKSLGQPLQFFSFTLFDPYGLGTYLRAPMPSFYFSLNLSLHFFCLIELRGCGMEPPQPHLLFIFITFNFSLLAEGLWVRTPTTSFKFLLIFSLNLPRRSWVRFTRHTSLFFHFLNSPSLRRGCGFDSHSTNFFFF